MLDRPTLRVRWFPNTSPMQGANFKKPLYFRGTEKELNKKKLNEEKLNSVDRPNKQPNYGKLAAYGAMFSKTIGGVALILSSLSGLFDGNVLPETKASEPVPIESPLNRTQAEDPKEVKKEINEWLDVLRESGFYLIGFGFFMGGFAEMNAGRKRKQPSFVLAPMAFMLASPLLAIDSNAARGLMGILLGFFLSGMGNTFEGLKTLEGKQPDSKFREFDMTPLLDWERWKRVRHSPIEREQFKSELRTLAKHLKADQKDVFAMIPVLPHQMKTMGQDIFKAGQALVKNEKLQITPNSDRYRTGSLLQYMGGALLIAGTFDPLVAKAGALLMGMGSGASALGMLSLGTQRDDWKGTFLKVGMPLYFIGDATIDTTAGYGARSIGAGAAYTLIGEANSDTPPDSQKKTKPKKIEPKKFENQPSK